MKKKICVILMILIVCVSTVVLAISPPKIGDGTVLSKNASGTVNKILGAIQWIGYAIAVGMLIYVGVKYVMSSAQEKADLKNSLVRYVIGAIIIAGAVTIVPWITGLISTNEGGTGTGSVEYNDPVGNEKMKVTVETP